MIRAGHLCGASTRHGPWGSEHDRLRRKRTRCREMRPLSRPRDPPIPSSMGSLTFGPGSAQLPPRRRQHLPGDLARRVRPRQRRGRPRHRRQPPAVGEQAADLRRQPRPASARRRGSRSPRRPPPCTWRWPSGGRRWRADTGSAPRAGPRRRSRRSIRRSARRRGRWPAAPRRSPRCSRAGRSAARAPGGSGRSRSPAACRTWKRAPANASTAAWLIERAPSEPPNTSTHVSSGTDSEARARRLAVGRRRRDRAAGDEVARRRRGPRSGRPGRPAWRPAPAAGWSGRDGCRPRISTSGIRREHGGEPHRTGHVAARAQHGGRPQLGEQPPGVPQRRRRPLRPREPLATAACGTAAATRSVRSS